MQRSCLFALVIIFGLTACASLSTKNRMEKFRQISDAYEFDLLDSDYRGAARFIDAKVTQKGLDQQQYKNIKIVAYTVTHMDISVDQLKIEQDVELQYFLLNSNRLRTTRHHQVWRYDETGEVWMLHTGLPRFNH